MATEVEGILALLVRGAMNHRKELREIGDFRLTEAQQKRVTDLVLESDSLRQFVNARIERATGGVLPTEDLVRAYFEYYNDEGWAPLPVGRVYRELADLMLEIFGSGLGSHGQSGSGVRVRGYPKVALRAKAA